MLRVPGPGLVRYGKLLRDVGDMLLPSIRRPAMGARRRTSSIGERRIGVYARVVR